MTEPANNPGYVDPKYLQQLGEYVRPLKERSYNLMNIQQGHKILDVGCGSATDTINFAKLVGKTGQVIGIDYDPQMIQLAEQKTKEAGVEAWLKHETVTAPPIPYDSEMFDSVHSERVFQHIPNADQMLAEMIRVTKPGGWVVVADTDHSSTSTDCSDSTLIDIEWRLRRFRAEMFINGYSGRQLFRLFKTNKLDKVSVEIFPIVVTDYGLGRFFSTADVVEKRASEAGIITEDELKSLHEMHTQIDQSGAFFGYATMMVVAGQKE